MSDTEQETPAPTGPVRIFNYSEAAKKFREFTKDEIDVFIKAFEEFDADGSGAIDAKELREAFNKMGQGASDEKINELLEEFDTDKSGQIDWPEYLQMMREFYPWKRFQYEIQYILPSRNFPEFSKSDIEVFIDSFREFDKDGSGSIDADELEIAFATMGQGVSRSDVEAILKEFDADESGEIEFDEFLEMMRDFYPFKRLIFEVEWYGPANKYPEFSRKEIDVFVWAFRDFDADDSGTIDAKELSNVFRSMGQGVSQAEIEEIMEEFSNEDGEIRWPEFLNIMRGFYPFKRLDYELEYYIPAKKFPEFSRNEIDVFSLTFRDFDADGSGSIDAKELGTALKKMGQGVTPERLKKIIDDVDDNGNGEIEWVEYLQIMRNFYPWKLAEFEKKFYEPAKDFPEFDKEDIDVFIDSFKEYDIDGNGSIDARELEIAFKRMGQGASKEKIQQMIDEADDNKNGVVEWVEFLGIMRKMYSGRTSAPPTKSAPAPTKTSPAPVKNAPAQTTPSKTTTAPTPVKSTTTTSSTPVKSTTAPAPTKTATTTTTTTPAKSSPPPAKSTFGQTKVTPTQTTGSTSSSMASHRANASCTACGKTVYPIESIGANDQTWHKGCFRCQEEGCGLVLNLKTFKYDGNKVYCAKHAPVNKPTQTSVSGSLSTLNATNVPKIQKVQGIKKNERMTFAPGELKAVGSEEGQEN